MYETVMVRMAITIPLEVSSRAVLDGVTLALEDAGYRVREVVFVEPVGVGEFPGLYGVTLRGDTGELEPGAAGPMGPGIPMSEGEWSSRGRGVGYA